MYKKIVERIVRSTTNENLSKVMDMIDTAFEQKQINWNDREILYALVVKHWKSYEVQSDRYIRSEQGNRRTDQRNPQGTESDLQA